MDVGTFWYIYFVVPGWCSLVRFETVQYGLVRLIQFVVWYGLIEIGTGCYILELFGTGRNGFIPLV